MVLVSNEWQNKSEDEHKSSANVVVAPSTAAAATRTATGTLSVSTGPPTSTGGATQATTAVAITSTISPSTATIVNADLSTSCNATAFAKSDTVAAPVPVVNSCNAKISPSPTTITTIKTTAAAETAAIIKALPLRKATTTDVAAAAANDNNNESRDKDEKQRHIQKDKFAGEFVCNNNRQQRQQSDNKESKEKSTAKEEDLVARILNDINYKIMAENAKETQLKEADAVDVIRDGNSTNTTASNVVSNHNSLEIDNTIIHDNNKTVVLLPTVTIKTQNIQNPDITQLQQQQQQQHKHYIPPPPPPQNRPEYIKSCLRTGIATMKANSPTAAAGLQPNFLSQLELAEDVAGLQATTTTYRPLCSTFSGGGGSAAGSALDMKNENANNNITHITDVSNILPDSHTNTVTVPSSSNDGQSKILLICEGNSHPFQPRTILLTPNVECMVGRLIAKSKAAENNAIFDCKVLSRKHAVIWYTPDGKFWVKDTKSSNGTFINDNKLGEEEAELHFGDVVKFGVDVVENSRKEVHGCIIACVKLYLPDGREAISIDSSTHRSQYSGEGRISYDDLHRLNLYIQETSQREKVLASKLCSIQNILESTRKNSGMCWQSMITEDQLLHRIHSLEKKLSFIEKNVPENVLRNEVLKLLDEKNSYQHTAKEALRKVYQERCDAMQMLAKMEAAYTQSDNECTLLRDQIMNSKQTLQDVNSRLLQMESEYNDFRDEMSRQQQEAKEREEQRIIDLSEKLRQREIECEDLTKKIAELLLKRADFLTSEEDEEEQLLAKQALEKLDAAIADMDVGEDDDDDEEDEDEDDNDNDNTGDEGEKVGELNKESNAMDVAGCVKKSYANVAAAFSSNEARIAADNVNAAAKTENDAFDSPTSNKESYKQTNLSTKVPSTLTSIFGASINGKEEKETTDQQENEIKLPKIKKGKMLAKLCLNNKPASQSKRVKESTIMKWLNNSDIKKNESSLDIFKAICNENEDDDDDEGDNDGNGNVEDDSSDDDDLCNDGQRKSSAEFKQKTKNFASILKNVDQNLKQLEAEIENSNTTAKGGGDDEKPHCAINEKRKQSQEDKRKKLSKDVYKFTEDSDDDDDSGSALAEKEEDESLIKRNGGQEASATSGSSYTVLSKNNKKYQLLKSSVNMLREAFNEIRDTVKEKKEKSAVASTSSPTPQQQHLNDIAMANNALPSLLDTPESSRASCDDIVDIDIDTCSEVESISRNSPVLSGQSTIKDYEKQTNTKEQQTLEKRNLLVEQLKNYQEKVSKLSEKLQNTELEAQHTLEIMQVECDDVKQKMFDLQHIIKILKEDKKALEQVINENKNNQTRNEEDKGIKSTSSSKGSCVEIIDSRLSTRREEDSIENDLADIDVTALEREEELITYKERLDEQQKENIELRSEIAALKFQVAGNGGRSSGGIVGISPTKSNVMLKRFLPYVFVLLAIIVYFLTTYF